MLIDPRSHHSRRHLLTGLAVMAAYAGLPARPAHADMLLTGAGKKPASAPAGFTLSPTDKNANIVLSNANLTGTKTNSNGFACVRANGKVASGKFSIRATINNDGFNFGLCSATASLSTLPGNNDDKGVAYSSYAGGAGEIYANNGTNVGAIGVGSVGDVIDVACDATARQVWFRRNGGAWSNGGDPEAGSGYITMNNGIATGDLYPFLQLYYSTSGGDQGTVDFGTSVSASYPAFNSVAS